MTAASAVNAKLRNSLARGLEEAMESHRTAGRYKGVCQMCGLPRSSRFVFVWPEKDLFNTLWVELLAGEETPDEDQKVMRNMVVNAGMQWAICRSVAEVEMLLIELGGLREFKRGLQ
jgi:hypothetical protein